MDFKRTQFKEVSERMSEPRRFIQVLAGPRQVGKSTLMDQVLAECPLPHYLFNADGVDEDDTDWIRRVWESVRTQMDTRQETEAVLVIDEIHKIKNWSEIVKREWDAGIIFHPAYGGGHLAEYLRDLRHLVRIGFPVVNMEGDSIYGVFRYGPFTRHKGEKVCAYGLGIIENQQFAVSGDGLGE